MKINDVMLHVWIEKEVEVDHDCCTMWYVFGRFGVLSGPYNQLSLCTWILLSHWKIEEFRCVKDIC